MPFFVVAYLSRSSAIPIEELYLNADNLAHAEMLARAKYRSIREASPGTLIRGFRILDADLEVVRPFEPESV